MLTYIIAGFYATVSLAMIFPFHFGLLLLIAFLFGVPLGGILEHIRMGEWWNDE